MSEQSTLGTTILLTAYLEDALKRISHIQSQKVPAAYKKRAMGLVLEALYSQLEPERLSLLREQTTPAPPPS